MLRRSRPAISSITQMRRGLPGASMWAACHPTLWMCAPYSYIELILSDANLKDAAPHRQHLVLHYFATDL